MKSDKAKSFFLSPSTRCFSNVLSPWFIQSLFSSGFIAYDKLPNDIKQKIKDAKGIFSSAGPISKTRLELERRSGIRSAEVFEAQHSIVQEVNGQKSLYVSPGHLISIKNTKGQENEKIKNCRGI